MSTSTQQTRLLKPDQINMWIARLEQALDNALYLSSIFGMKTISKELNIVQIACKHLKRHIEEIHHAN